MDQSYGRSLDQYLVMAYTIVKNKRPRDHSGISAFIGRARLKASRPTRCVELAASASRRRGISGRRNSRRDMPATRRRFPHRHVGARQWRYTVAAGAIGLDPACLDASTKICQRAQTFKSRDRQASALQQ